MLSLVQTGTWPILPSVLSLPVRASTALFHIVGLRPQFLIHSASLGQTFFLKGQAVLLWLKILVIEEELAHRKAIEESVQA